MSRNKEMDCICKVKLFVIIIPALFLMLPGLKAAPPAGYYDSATGLTGTALRQELHNIIDDHEHLTYTDDTRDVVAAADEDPNNSSNILDVYKNASYAKTDTTSWNQEHAWPKSYGFPDETSCNYPYTDCHHLFACDASYNSFRGNNPFDFCLSSCTTYPALPLESGLANYRSGSGNTGSWEVWPGRRGDVARALLYLDVRYEGGTHSITKCAEPDLILTNNKNDIATTGENASVAYMGVLDTLLQWHQTDPVDDKERHRNDVVYPKQGNRNPFIDHPEWVAEIWGTVPTPTPTATPIIGVSPGDIVINEIDYDDTSTDDQSFIELKNLSGVSINLSTLEVVGLSSGTSTIYLNYRLQSNILSPGEYHVLGTTTESSGISSSIDETMTGVPSLQNGPNDGIYIRLFDPSHTIIDSVSYEGDKAHPAGSPDTGNAGTDSGSINFKSLSRTPDGKDTNNNSDDFTLSTSTPGQANTTPTPTPTATATPTSTPTTTPTPTSTPASEISPGDIVINEIDCSDPGADDQSFIELMNISEKSLDVSTLQVAGLSSGTATVYFTYRLQTRILAPGARHVLGTTADSGGVAAFIDETMTGVESIQNGPDDGIYLRLYDSPSIIIDSVSYDGDKAHPIGSPDAGNAGTDPGTEENISLSRIPDGIDTNNNASDFKIAPSTPRGANVKPTPTPTPLPPNSGFFLH
jgi:endonuclease I